MLVVVIISGGIERVLLLLLLGGLTVIIRLRKEVDILRGIVLLTLRVIIGRGRGRDRPRPVPHDAVQQVYQIVLRGKGLALAQLLHAHSFRDCTHRWTSSRVVLKAEGRGMHKEMMLSFQRK